MTSHQSEPWFIQNKAFKNMLKLRERYIESAFMWLGNCSEEQQESIALNILNELTTMLTELSANKQDLDGYYIYNKSQKYVKWLHNLCNGLGTPLIMQKGDVAKEED